jgi:transcriptional regulator with XRE-family HTH domain
VAISGTDIHAGKLLRDFRESRRLSVRTLAAKAGFSSAFISQLENGQTSPSIASLEKIADALGVALVEFFGPAGNESVVVRAQNRPLLECQWSKAAIASLRVDSASRLEPRLITLRPGGSSGKRPHTFYREQFAFVLAGELALHLDGTEHVLGRLDAVTIAPSTAFRWVNAGGTPAQLLVVSSRVE